MVSISKDVLLHISKFLEKIVNLSMFEIITVKWGDLDSWGDLDQT